jgi:uncharacterized protein (DUF2062 family)
VTAEDHHHRKEHFARIRRTKLFLRFMPRKAVFHKYPFIGRFADVARKRSYLWSFKTPEVRPALYVGSVLAFMPALGVQLPAAFLLALLLRLNVMVLGGLQFITNPLTAPAIYYGTYQLGKAVIDASGFGRSIEVVEDAHPYVAPERAPRATPATPAPAPSSPATAPAPDDDAPFEIKWSRVLGTTFNALIIGGVLAGLIVGGVLDLLWRFGAARAARHRERVAARRRARSHSTPPRPAAK